MPSLAPPVSDLILGGGDRTAHTAVAPASGPDANGSPVSLPGVGDVFAGFRLVEVLGEGAFGRVFLAEEEDLAGRRVVLKITARANDEPRRLARLQHTNIVPIQTAFRADGLFAVQMPYFGRQTLADLVELARSDRDFPRVDASVFSTAARQTTAPRPGSRPRVPTAPPAAPTAPPAEAPHPLRTALARLGYVGAVVWLAERVADALAHAHARGVLHLDLKPANVLFGDDGQPMLLDFNLSYDTARMSRDRLGGTWPYMAPEQIREYVELPGPGVDARTDLYALGVMLFELLACRQPFASPPRPDGVKVALAAREVGPPPLNAINPVVPPAVAAVVKKLLAADPADRYQTAEQLRDDLARHRQDLPLRHAPNPSLWERAGKGRRRHARVLPYLFLAVAVAAASAGGVGVLRLSVAAVEARAADTARELKTALVPVRADLLAPTDPVARRAGLAAGKLWLDRYGVPANADYADVPLVRDLPPAARQETADRLGELAALMAHAERAEAKTDKAALVRAAGWSRTATAWFGPDRVPAAVWEQRLAIADTAGDGELKATVPDARPAGEPTPTDLLLRGAEHLAAGKYAAAEGPFAAMAERSRDDFAAQFALAYCLHQTGQNVRALERYQVARAVAPADPRPAYHRGLILSFLLKHREAEAEFTASLDRAPGHPDTLWYRALARKRLGDDRGAAEDLTRGLAVGVPRLSALLYRAEAYTRLGDAAAAAADRAEAAKLEPTTEREFLSRGASRVRADKNGALADFMAATALNPDSLAGWQNQAHVLGDLLNRPAEAVTAQEKAVACQPDFAAARSGLAVLYARAGRRADAHREAARALQLSDDATVTYQAANAYALTAKAHPADADTALGYLRQALRSGYRDVAGIATDPDMAYIKNLPEFQKAVTAAKELAR